MHDYYLTRNVPARLFQAYTLVELAAKAKARLMDILAVNHEAVSTLAEADRLALANRDFTKTLFVVKGADDLGGASLQLDRFLQSL